MVIPLSGKNTAKSDKTVAEMAADLAFRSIGPAFMSGRISDIAIDPGDVQTWYVAAGSGGVWKTANGGITFQPVFDSQGSYSIGCVTVDPHCSLTVWVGSGENVSGRHVGYGDGVYKSLDGGKTWKNMGLKNSEHIDRILIHPDNSQVVYVAAEGPLWSPGGERGVYRTEDGGKTWERILAIDENTGVTDLVMHPEDPRIMFAAAHQRRRTVAALINGGPGSAIYRTRDGGKTWEKCIRGLPKEDLGQIALAISPQDPRVLYASVETAIRRITYYRSEDGGSSWQKMIAYTTPSTGPHYYQELYASPHQFDRIYSMEINILFSDDGGKNWDRMSEEHKHGDNHALAFDPGDPQHILCGSDGGLYETFDHGKSWRYVSNLPLTQFYRIALDNNGPFYNIIGGTQDNCTQLGPSATLYENGIANSEWRITLGGDGYSCQIDPENPDIMYCESQVGNLARYDKRSGEATDIKPMPDPGEDPPRWNWDSPVIISPHSHTRLYFASQRLYRSDDRGNSWQVISGDLSRARERLQMEYMGRTWSVDAVWDNDAMSYYGNVVTISESPLLEGLIYCGTDDGLLQVTPDGGRTWRKIEKFPGVPQGTFVNEVFASRHRADTVFVLLDNHKRGDFSPYILKSADRGKTWIPLTGNLPERHVLWALEQDYQEPDLLFLGTEFGLFYTVDGGGRWVPFTKGLPTIAFRDIKIQPQEDDLVAASFGRGIYILDDYSPLRRVADINAGKDALFPVRDVPAYFPIDKLGGGEKGSLGHGFYSGSNPPFGACFTYYLSSSLKSGKTIRRDAEKKRAEQRQDVSFPGWETLRREEREDKPRILLEIMDSQGEIVRRLSGPVSRGFHRVHWDLTYSSLAPVRLEQPAPSPFSYGFGRERSGHPIVPGTYTVKLYRATGKEKVQAGEGRTFKCYAPGLVSLPADDFGELLDFRKKCARLQRKVAGAARIIDQSLERIQYLNKALERVRGENRSLLEVSRTLQNRLLDLQDRLYGDSSRYRRAEPTAPGIYSRLGAALWTVSGSNSEPTQTARRQLELAGEQFESFVMDLTRITGKELPRLLQQAREAGAPWIPGFELEQ